MNVGCPCTPGSDKILATVDVATEDVDVGVWVGLRDANERYETIPRSDAAVEVVVLPGLAMAGEGLGKRDQRNGRGRKKEKRTSPVMTMSLIPVQTVSMNSSKISGYSS